MKLTLSTSKGFSLVELTVLIIIIGILTAVAMQSMTSVIEDARQVKTEREMQLLADAIVGDPDLTSGGVRSEFGYLGDVGAFPPNLNNLVTNPGGFSTWKGPYLSGRFSQDTIGMKTDEWGTAYGYTGGVTITSTGSGTTITKKIADATSDYLLNTLNGTIRDASDSVPGLTYFDSVDIVITIPNGAGGTVTKTYLPNSAGTFLLDSLPAGKHSLSIIYNPNVDTLHRYVTILPRHKSSVSYKFASAYFSGGGGGGGGLVYVNGSASTQGGNCDKFTFDITNTTSSAVTLTSLVLNWTSPTAYYKEIKIDGNKVYDQNNPRIGSGQTAGFDSPFVLGAGQTVTVEIKGFKDAPTGGNKVNMSNTDMTATFSDGSVVTFNTGACN